MVWGCNFGPMSGGWWGVFFPGSLFSLLLWGLMIILIIYIAIRIFRSQKHAFEGPSRDRLDSEEILKTRFAKGEISQEEFIEMKKILSQS